MNLVTYLVSLTLLLVASLVVIRVPVRRHYLSQGCLSPSTAALQAIVFFAYGGYPSFYLPGEWPNSEVTITPKIVGTAGIQDCRV